MRAMLLLKQQHRNCKILLPGLNTNNNNNKVQSYSMYIRININKESHLLQFWQNSKHMQAVVNYLAVYIKQQQLQQQRTNQIANNEAANNELYR